MAAGPAARAGGTGHARPPPRALRRLRRRRPGGPPGRRGPVARPGPAGQRQGLAPDRRVAPAGQPAAEGRSPAATGADRGRPRPHGCRRSPARRRRHPHPALPVLPPSRVAPGAGGADATGRGRADHRRDRPGIPRARGHDGPADQPGQATGQGERRRVPPATGRRAVRPAPGRTPGALPAVQRGLHRDVGVGPGAPRPDRRGHPPGAGAAPPGARRGRGHRPAGAHAAHRGPAARSHRPRRRPRAPRRAGPRPVGHRRHRRGNRARHRLAGDQTAGPVPTAGRHRRPARRGHDGRRHRLAPDPGPLRAARARGTEPDGHPQPRRGPRDGARATRRPRPPRHPHRRRPGQRAHRVDSVRAHLLEMAGDHRAAHAAYQHAARRTTSVPERRHLLARAANLPLDDDDGGGPTA